MECGVISALFWQWLCFFLYSSRSSPSNIKYISHFFAKRLILPAASTNIHLQNVSSLNWYIWWFFGELDCYCVGYFSCMCSFLFCSISLHPISLADKHGVSMRRPGSAARLCQTVLVALKQRDKSCVCQHCSFLVWTHLWAFACFANDAVLLLSLVCVQTYLRTWSHTGYRRLKESHLSQHVHSGWICFGPVKSLPCQLMELQGISCCKQLSWPGESVWLRGQLGAVWVDWPKLRLPPNVFKSFWAAAPVSFWTSPFTWGTV